MSRLEDEAVERIRTALFAGWPLSRADIEVLFRAYIYYANENYRLEARVRDLRGLIEEYEHKVAVEEHDRAQR